MKHSFFLILVITSLCSCRDGELKIEPKPEVYLRAADLSTLPEIRESEVSYFDASGNEVDALEHMKEAGMNCVRLRLWVDPIDAHSSLEEVKEFTEEIRSLNLGLWITVHYSDTWADPGNQVKPGSWENLSFIALKNRAADYTRQVVQELQPDYIQIGNEINNGMLFPNGHRWVAPEEFLELLQALTEAVRAESESTQIILHYAGHAAALEFTQEVSEVDYDVIGLSYYPIWHGKDLQKLSSEMDAIRLNSGKEVLIAETAYPFTLDWKDWTNNIVGLEEQIILPEFPASENGQANFMAEIDAICKNSSALGWAYWGGEMIAHRGDTATDGSPWENQALFDFENRALPVLDVFRSDSP